MRIKNQNFLDSSGKDAMLASQEHREVLSSKLLYKLGTENWSPFTENSASHPKIELKIELNL